MLWRTILETLVFTPLVKAPQEKYGSRRQYARMEAGHPSRDPLGADQSAFIAECDSFYQGILKVIDDHTIAFADFRGNKQFSPRG